MKKESTSLRNSAVFIHVYLRGPRRSKLPSFKRPCRYCSKLVMPEDVTCPFCGKESPIYIRCPKCKAEVKRDYQKCPSCGQALQIICTKCGKQTFFDVYCDACGQKQEVECPKCHTKQPPVFTNCISCKKQLPLIAKAATATS